MLCLLAMQADYSTNSALHALFEYKPQVTLNFSLSLLKCGMQNYLMQSHEFLSLFKIICHFFLKTAFEFSLSGGYYPIVNNC